jgi:hypothetical protein
MVFVCIKESLEGKQSILASKGGSAVKLEFDTVQFEEMEGSTIHDR